jgi:DNA-binding response OmpR family regulator
VIIRKKECSQTTNTTVFQEGCCEICVRDNGIGMPKELVDKIFNRFYQIANTESVKMIGTGIGLSLVESIVHLHYGKVAVQAEAGEGSEFILHLPLGTKHLAEDQIIPHFKNSEDLSHYAPDRASAALGGALLSPLLSSKVSPSLAGSLLIVEDNPKIRKFICSIFADRYQITEAENGKEGLQLARSTAPDLIISDIMMPELDGINLCRALKQKEKTSHIPIILLTARSSNVFQVEGFHSGADAYVTKPFQPSVLKAQVTSMLDARLRLREYFSRKVTLQPSDIEITSEDEQFIKNAIQVIEDNLDKEHLGKEFLAQAMAMSPSSLYRKVKSTTDLSINAFIRSIRLRRAAQLIQNTQYNISEVSYQVGFNDLKYFRKCFRKQFGKNPSEFSDQSLLASSEDLP